MKNIVVLSSLLFIMNLMGVAQIYSVKYECTFNTNFGEANKDSGNNQIDLPLVSKIIYELLADKNYLSIKGRLIEAVTFPGVELNTKASSTSIIIDLKKQVAYFPDEKIYQRIKYYRLTDTCNESKGQIKSVSGNYLSAKIKFDYAIPWFVSPGLLFQKEYRCGSVFSIDDEKLHIVRIGEPDVKQGRLNFEKFFPEGYLKKISGIYAFLD